MRIVVTGATGNVGTSCLAALAAEARVKEILGIARRQPAIAFMKAKFATADVGRDDLQRLFEGAHAVVHLAWDINSRDEAGLFRTNVEGSKRVFRTAAQAGVGALLYASSVGVYSPGPGRTVDESWPRNGIPSSSYSRHKVRVERELDEVEAEFPKLRIVRFRPALIFKREAASGIQRLFMGHLAPPFMFKPGRVPFVPAKLTLQCVQSLDVGQAFRAASVRDVSGPFNLAAEPALGSDALAELLDTRKLPIAPQLLRGLAAVSHALRLQPSEAGWVDLAFNVPILKCERARRELDWQPQSTASEALLELLDGLRHGAGLPTPRLKPRLESAWHR